MYAPAKTTLCQRIELKSIDSKEVGVSTTRSVKYLRTQPIKILGKQKLPKEYKRWRGRPCHLATAVTKRRQRETSLFYDNGPSQGQCALLIRGEAGLQRFLVKRVVGIDDRVRFSETTEGFFLRPVHLMLLKR